MYCIVLCCIVLVLLYCIVLYCTVLYCIVLYCFTLHFRRRFADWISTVYLVRKLQIILQPQFLILVTIRIVQLSRITNQFNLLLSDHIYLSKNIFIMFCQYQSFIWTSGHGIFKRRSFIGCYMLVRTVHWRKCERDYFSTHRVSCSVLSSFCTVLYWGLQCCMKCTIQYNTILYELHYTVLYCAVRTAL